jgi:hypothetical protein
MVDNVPLIPPASRRGAVRRIAAVIRPVGGAVIGRFRHPGIVDNGFDRASKMHANGSGYEIGTCRVIKSPRLHTRSSFLLMWIGSGRQSRERRDAGAARCTEWRGPTPRLCSRAQQAKTISRMRPSRQQGKPTARLSRLDGSPARFTTPSDRPTTCSPGRGGRSRPGIAWSQAVRLSGILPIVAPPPLPRLVRDVVLTAFADSPEASPAPASRRAKRG